VVRRADEETGGREDGTADDATGLDEAGLDDAGGLTEAAEVPAAVGNGRALHADSSTASTPSVGTPQRTMAVRLAARQPGHRRRKRRQDDLVGKSGTADSSSGGRPDAVLGSVGTAGCVPAPGPSRSGGVPV